MFVYEIQKRTIAMKVKASVYSNFRKNALSVDVFFLFSLILTEIQLLGNSFLRFSAVKVKQYPRMIFSDVFSFERKKIQLASKMMQISNY